MLLGMDHTRPPLFQCLELDQRVTVTLRDHVFSGYLSVIVNICCHRLSHCGLDWDCMLLEWNGLYTWLIVCVTMTLRAHVLVIVRVVNE